LAATRSFAGSAKAEWARYTKACTAAIKVLLPEYAHQPDVVRRFFNEAKAVNAINHPGVVQVSDVGTAEDGSLFLVMEFLEGQTLSERLSQHGGRLNQSDTVSIAWQLAGVLTAAHSKNIVHRDLKPGNVMLVPDMAGPDGERVKLLDFGIAKLGVEHLQDQDVKTRTGQILGTAAYMSPEQFMGNRAIDAQTDVYSLGIMLFRMLAGSVPFTSTNGEMALGMMHLMEAPPPLAEQAPETSPWLVELVHRMLAKSTAALACA
jgi:serine/threonine-protein kinase